MIIKVHILLFCVEQQNGLLHKFIMKSFLTFAVLQIFSMLKTSSSRIQVQDIREGFLAPTGAQEKSREDLGSLDVTL